MARSGRLALLVICTLALAGCGGSAGGQAGKQSTATGTAPPPPVRSVASSPSPQCYALVRQQPNRYQQVSCADPAADASVTERDTASPGSVEGSDKYEYTCPDGTDYILDVGAAPAEEVASMDLGADQSTVSATSGTHPDYACMRTLKIPHRGEPGGGGGGQIGIDDCVRPGASASIGPVVRQSVLEVRCVEAIWYQPVYRVFQVDIIPCPSNTTFAFTITPLGRLGNNACANPV